MIQLYSTSWSLEEENVDQLIGYLEKREDFNLTKLNWSTGIILMTRKT